MLHVESRWHLPGPSSTYLVVWWYDEVAKEPRHHVPVGVVLSRLPRWLRSCRLTLRRIDAALGGGPSRSASRIESDRDVEQLGKRIAEAIRMGKLAVVRAPSTRSGVKGAPWLAPSTASEGVSATILVVDETGAPVPNAGYRIETADGIREGSVDSRGQAREERLIADDHRITLTK